MGPSPRVWGSQRESTTRAFPLFGRLSEGSCRVAEETEGTEAGVEGKERHELVPTADPELYTCQRCLKDKPVDDFQRNRYGLTATCRECRKKMLEESPPIPQPQLSQQNEEEVATIPSDSQPLRHILSTFLETIAATCIDIASYLRQEARKNNTKEDQNE